MDVSLCNHVEAITQPNSVSIRTWGKRYVNYHTTILSMITNLPCQMFRLTLSKNHCIYSNMI